MTLLLAVAGAWYSTLVVHLTIVGLMALALLRVANPGAAARAWVLRVALFVPLATATAVQQARRDEREVKVTTVTGSSAGVVVNATAHVTWPLLPRIGMVAALLMASAGLVVWGASRRRWYRRLLRRTAVEPHVLGVDDELLALGAGRRATLSLCRETSGAFALGRGEVVIAPTLAKEWHADELRAVVAHECAHLRRRDAAWFTAASVLQAALWPLPVVHALVRQLHVECEYAADADAVARTRDPGAYARALARTTTVGQPAWSAALGGRPSLLVRRAERVLGAPAISRPWVAWGLVVGLAIAAWSLPGVEPPGWRTQVTATVAR